MGCQSVFVKLKNESISKAVLVFKVSGKESQWGRWDKTKESLQEAWISWWWINTEEVYKEGWLECIYGFEFQGGEGT
jgi:hypothetical protein